MTHTLPLSPIDHVFTGAGAYPLEFVFAYGGAIDAGRLQEALRRTLALFPAFASRLRREGARYVLEPAPDACLLELATSASPFADAPRARSVRFVHPVATRDGEPLTRLRLTQTPAGSVLGVAVSHAVADGFSYFHFLAAWSRAFRGEPFPQPWNDRALLAAAPRAAPPGEHDALPLTADRVRDGCGLFLGAPRREVPRGTLAWERRVFTAAELRELHASAQAGCPVRLSHNDVVAAWLWREHVSVWADPGEAVAWLSCPVDVRRLLPGFPPFYSGCAVALAAASIERHRLAQEPLGALARRVRDAVAGVDAAAAWRSLSTIDGVREALGLAGLERLHVVHPRAGLLVTNLSRLPVREIVFDAGPPTGYDVLVPAERCAIVLPAGDGLDVRVCGPGAAPHEPEDAPEPAWSAA